MLSKEVSQLLIFNEALAFEGNLSTWDKGLVTDMNYMLSRAPLFDSDLSTWNTSSLLVVIGMFHKAALFDSNISSWDVDGCIAHVWFGFFFLARCLGLGCFLIEECLRHVFRCREFQYNFVFVGEQVRECYQHQ